MSEVDAFLVGSAHVLGTALVILVLLALCIGLAYVCFHGLVAIGLHLPAIKPLDDDQLKRVMDWSARKKHLYCWGRYGAILIQTGGKEPWITKKINGLFDQGQPHE